MYKLKTLISFKHKDGKMRRRGKIFDEVDKKYVDRLIGWKLVEVVAIIEPKEKVKKVEKAKEGYKKKIVEPEINKAKESPGTGVKMEGTEVKLGETGTIKVYGEKTEKKPITTGQFKTKTRKPYTRSVSKKWPYKEE